MKPVFKVSIILLFAAAIPLEAQVAPEATSPRQLGVNGNLSYSARYSQIENFYSDSSSGQTANLSGDFAYATNNERAPFSVTFGGGYNWTVSGTAYNSGPYENLSLAQGIIGHHWSLQLSDSVGYHQGAPITGFSGVPGSGEPISGSNPTSSPDETILTLNTIMLNNDASATYSYRLSAFTSLTAGGGANWLMFPDGGGFNTDSYLADFGLTHRLNARNSIFGNYAFSEYSYSGFAITTDANTAMFGWQRTWSRNLSSSVSAGPQWIGSSESSLVPSTTGVSASATISYNTKLGVAGLTYSHGVAAGGGYLYSGEQDSVTGSFGHQFGREVGSQLSVEFAGGYRLTSSLISQAASTGGSTPGAFTGDISAEYGSAQATRALGRYFSVFASYTGTNQAYSSQNSGASSNVLIGLWQIISFGVGYTPQPVHLRH